MKKLLLTILVLAILGNISVINAQPWMDLLPKEKKQSELTFYDYQKAFNDYWEPFNLDNGYMIVDGKKVKAPGWKQFKRWEYDMYSLINLETGEIPKENAYYLTEQNRQKNPHVYPKSTIANWIPLGPKQSLGRYHGIGRINCVAFHPTDLNTYWVGAASGGLWKTTDNGNTWKCLTDNNGVLAVSDIIIPSDYSTSNTIYIATGDRDGFDNYSIGVLKSTNGGLTWNNTDLSYDIYNGSLMINRLLIDPNNNNVLIAATSNGVCKTTNGGATWSQFLTYNVFIDMEYKPGNFNTLYGSTKNGSIFVSTNGGSTWTEAINLQDGARIELAVSPANPSIVYAVSSNRSSSLLGIYKSTNSGNSYSQVFSGEDKNLLGRSSFGDDFGVGQGWYDLCIEVSPINANMVFVGGINTWYSTNGGTSWELANFWVSSGTNGAHADKHTLRYRNNGDLFEGNDGGIYISNDNGTIWEDKTNGMDISQIYRIGVSATDPNDIIAGLQDNGTKSLSNGEWVDVLSGDGMNCMIDYSDNNIQYGCSQNGNIGVTFTHWETWRGIKPDGVGSGAWITPFIMDPVNPATIYIGYSDLWKSTNRGSSWTKISNLNTDYKILSIAIAPSNNQVLYIANSTKIWKTTDGGNSWAEITANLPYISSSITSITINNTNHNTIWITVGGFSGNSIFESNNGGMTWTNISEGLPPIPAYIVVQNKQSLYETHLYLGTEAGVYFKKGGDNWVFYNNGLPNVKIRDLEIYYGNSIENSRLRAGTYGRGAWETSLYYLEQMLFVSCTTTQDKISDVNVNSTNQEIIGVKIETTGSLNPLRVSSITFNTNGSTNPSNDIVNAKLYYTGTNNHFSTNTQIGTTVINPDGTFTIPTSLTLSNGINYLWLAYDISGSAEINNFVDAECTSITIGEERIPNVSSPVGNRKISIAYCETEGDAGYESISNVKLGSIDNTSSNSARGYQNFSYLVTDVAIGVPTNFSISVANSYNLDRIIIWADLNNNILFDADEQLYFSNEPNFTSPENGSFTIPEGTSLGEKRLRIKLIASSGLDVINYSPCGDFHYGEVEDYTINIVNNINIANNNDNNIQIFPNPAKDKLYIINNKYIINDVSLLDLFGKELINFNNLNNTEIIINLENINSGTYLLKIKTEQGYFNTKILKVD